MHEHASDKRVLKAELKSLRFDVQLVLVDELMQDASSLQQ
jgi:hypothetical protein